MPALKGIDNVLFSVTDLDAAVAFYSACGFTVKFRVDQAKMALFDYIDGACRLFATTEGESDPHTHPRSTNKPVHRTGSTQTAHWATWRLIA